MWVEPALEVLACCCSFIVGVGGAFRLFLWCFRFGLRGVAVWGMAVSLSSKSSGEFCCSFSWSSLA